MLGDPNCSAALLSSPTLLHLLLSTSRFLPMPPFYFVLLLTPPFFFLSRLCAERYFFFAPRVRSLARSRLFFLPFSLVVVSGIVCAELVLILFFYLLRLFLFFLPPPLPAPFGFRSKRVRRRVLFSLFSLFLNRSLRQSSFFPVCFGKPTCVCARARACVRSFVRSRSRSLARARAHAVQRCFRSFSILDCFRACVSFLFFFSQAVRGS